MPTISIDRECPWRLPRPLAWAPARLSVCLSPTYFSDLGLAGDELYALLGREYTEEEFEQLCFDFGIELDEVTSAAEEEAKRLGKDVDPAATSEGGVVYKIDIPANRYDLLCLEGLSRSLNIFLGREKVPDYRLVEPASGQRERLFVKPSVDRVRPFVVSAILRNVTFNENSYKSFIELQDKLHQNICRRRTLVAIGTHDYDTLQGPFTYDAQEPSSIEFVPLVPPDRSFTAKELLNFYNTDPTVKHLKPYTGIISESPVYPVVLDANGVVCSLPPVINGHHSRIQLTTRNVFIECTATDLNKANIVLDTVITMFSQYCAEPFTAEPVDVIYEASGKTDVTPKLMKRSHEASVRSICETLGVEIEPAEICRLCERMQLGPAQVVQDGKGQMVQVTVPPTRSDILHACDIIEDVGIAYGFNNIPLRLPATQTVGAPLRINHFADLLREEVARAGYTEILTHGLCSRVENFSLLRRHPVPAVSLSNPANVEYEIVRTSLMTGILKTLQHNRSTSVRDGLRLFEVSDVVLRDDSCDTGARNQRRLVAAYAGTKAGFEIVHGLVDRVMQVLQVQPSMAYAGNSLRAGESDAALGGPWREGMEYSIKPVEDPAFLPGRCAGVLLARGGQSTQLGTFGVVHPEILKNFDLPFPCSVVEFEVESLI
jgi:phenylalanyl-tRNA synthetase beta chain